MRSQWQFQYQQLKYLGPIAWKILMLTGARSTANFSLCVSADVLCTSSRICYASVIVFMAVAAPLIVYFAVTTSNPEFKSEIWTCNIKIEYR